MKRLKCYHTARVSAVDDKSDDGSYSESESDDGITESAIAEDENHYYQKPPLRGGKRVHFGTPLVTMVRHRPKTDFEDIPKLYFVEDELEVLEEDRIHTASDQFECTIQGEVHHSAKRQPVQSYFET